MNAVQAFAMEHAMDSHTLHLPGGVAWHLPPFLTVHGVMVLCMAGLLLLVAAIARSPRNRATRRLATALEMFVQFVRDEIAIPYLGETDGRRLTPLFCTFFSLILVMNMSGLIPMVPVATSNLSVTLPLASITLFVMIFGAIHKNGLIGFLKGFIPEGVPIPLVILLYPLEFASVFVRSFALMIRLFANMLAGHIVLFCILGIVVAAGVYALPIIVLALMVNLIEVMIVFLQAYIFTLLSAVFIGQTYHPAH